MSLISVLQAAIDFVLFKTQRLSPLYALLGAIAMILGWGVQIGFWAPCEFAWHGRDTWPSGVCYTWAIDQEDWHPMFETPIAVSRLGLACLLVIG